MKSLHHRIFRQFIWIGLLLSLSSPGWGASGIVESALEFGRFGKVILYSPSGEPDQVVLFISGDGGWNLGVVDGARELVGLGALVVGTDIRHFLKSVEPARVSAPNPAADFESLGQFVQKRLDYRTFHRPVLVGYSSGATLAYATLAASPSRYLLRRGQPGFLPRSDAAQAHVQGGRPRPHGRPEAGSGVRSRCPAG